MARTNTLGNFLTDVADAIRTKKGTEATIAAADFDTEIANLPSGGGADLSDYFTETISGGNNAGYVKTIKKLPAFTLANNTCAYLYNNFSGTEIDLSELDMTDISNATQMFNNCVNIISLDFSNINLSSLSNANQMFGWMSSLTSITFSNNGPTNSDFYGQGMFYNCSALTNLNLSSFNITIKNTGNCSSMFRSCSSLQKLDIRGITFPTLSSSTNTFSEVPAGCLIIVKDSTEKDKVLAERSDFTNVKTVAEYEAQQNA